MRRLWVRASPGANFDHIWRRHMQSAKSKRAFLMKTFRQTHNVQLLICFFLNFGNIYFHAVCKLCAIALDFRGVSFHFSWAAHGSKQIRCSTFRQRNNIRSSEMRKQFIWQFLTAMFWSTGLRSRSWAFFLEQPELKLKIRSRSSTQFKI